MIHTKDNEKILNEYFEWMYHLVCNGKHYTKVSYKRLLYFLNSVDFIPHLAMDENRMIAGKEFRYEFAACNGYTNQYVEENLDIYDCSMLEMMIALSYRIEQQITTDNSYGDRTGQWFWSMIVSLGLGHMDDLHFNRQYCNDVMCRFMHNQYSPKGDGGLFKLENPPGDMRDVDIWCQCMWYLNETVYDTQIR